MTRAMKKRTRTLKEVARQIGVAPVTLRRWLLAGKVPDVARDRNNWRVFSDKDIARIRRFALRITRSSEK